MEPESFNNFNCQDTDKYYSQNDHTYFESCIGRTEFSSEDLSNFDNPMDDDTGTVGDKADTIYCVIA